MKMVKHKKSIKVPKYLVNRLKKENRIFKDQLANAKPGDVVSHPRRGDVMILDLPPRREIDLQREIIRWAKARGYACGKTKIQGMKQSDGRYYKDRLSFRGFPDLVMFTPGLVFVEVKGPKGRLRPDQREFQEFCRKAEVKYIVAKSVMDVIKEVGE